MIDPGDLIIAPPRLPDPRFRESVIMITHHHSQSIGLVLNKPLPNTLREITDKLNIELDQDQPLYWGGPMATTTVWMLHDRGWHHPHSMEISQDWSVLSHVSMFQQFVDQSLPLYFRIFMGCSSWAPEQLVSEIQGDPPWSQRHSWLTLRRPQTSWVLDPDPDQHWLRTVDLSVKSAALQCL